MELKMKLHRQEWFVLFTITGSLINSIPDVKD